MIEKKINRISSKQITRVKSVDFHPLKSMFIIGLHNGRIQAWDYNYNACVYEFVDPDTLEMGSVRSVRFHPHGDFFVSCSDDKIIRMWNFTKRSLSKTFKGHIDFIRSVDFHPTKPWIISSSDDQTIKIWNFMTGKCIATATGHSHYVMSAKFLEDNLIISASLDNTIRIWDCNNLFEKTSKFVPDIIVKQIIQGHDRGINFLQVYNRNDDLLILSGADDREIKIWEYRNDLIEIESFVAHQGCITDGILYEDYVISVGEDGLCSFYDIKTRKQTKFKVDGRLWTISGKNGLFVAGHDLGFELLEYKEPILVFKKDRGCFYLKKTHFYYSDLNTENKICKAEGSVVSINSIDKYFLIQYETKFEVYCQNKKILKENGTGVLLFDDDLLIVNKKEGVINILDLQGKKINSFSCLGDNLLFGNFDTFFVSKQNSIAKYTKNEFVETFNLGFNCNRVIVSPCNKFVAFLSTNTLAIYDTKFNLINFENELGSIKYGFFYNNIFIYSTTKHIKYMFKESGILISIDTIAYPFHYEDNTIYYLGNDGIESIEVDFTEIIFKKFVLEDQEHDEITKIIESGSLPGLASLSFLIKRHRGDIALPYIKNNKQRFELCLSIGKLDECFEYCKEMNDCEMYKRLNDVALENMNFEIAEKCLLFLQEWHELFFLYVCANKLNKFDKLAEICDEETRQIINLYLENKKYFFKDRKDTKYGNASKYKKISNTSKDTSKNNNSCTNNIEKDLKSIQLIFDKKKLEKLQYEVVDVDLTYNEGLECVSRGEFKSAIEKFKNCLYTIAENLDSSDYQLKLRKNLGSYISGLLICMLRKKEENDEKQIWYANYFALLDLKDEHKTLANLELINVCLKNGNFLQAKEVAIKMGDDVKSKLVKKAMKNESQENAYKIPQGSFCFDIQEYKKQYKYCKFCHIKNYKSNICALCEIGYLVY